MPQTHNCRVSGRVGEFRLGKTIRRAHPSLQRRLAYEYMCVNHNLGIFLWKGIRMETQFPTLSSGGDSPPAEVRRHCAQTFRRGPARTADQTWVGVAAHGAGGVRADCGPAAKSVSEDLPPGKLPARTQCRDHRHRSKIGGGDLACAVQGCVVPGACKTRKRRIGFSQVTCSDGQSFACLLERPNYDCRAQVR
jgi:hypothetical protein